MKSKVYKVQCFVHVFRCEYLCKVETGKNLAINFYLQQFRVIRDHLNSKCLTSIINFDIQVRSSIQ